MSPGVFPCSGKCFVFPQHGDIFFEDDCGDAEETGAWVVFSIPQWHTFPLQHPQAQWLDADAADKDFQPLLWVNGWEMLKKNEETTMPITFNIGPLPFGIY